MEQLPEGFIRCHNSFLINQERIASVDWSAMKIYLNERISVPMSRNYRVKVKEQIYGNNTE
jgi:DNA-binding LytR/AlgR family response regulator